MFGFLADYTRRSAIYLMPLHKNRRAHDWPNCAKDAHEHGHSAGCAHEKRGETSYGSRPSSFGI